MKTNKYRRAAAVMVVGAAVAPGLNLRQIEGLEKKQESKSRKKRRQYRKLAGISKA